MSRNRLPSRRDCFRLAAAGGAGASVSGWLGRLASAATDDARRRRSCILLWMGGGPSQTDTFDLKPGHANGGPFKETATSVPGIRISEHLPKIAARMQHMAIIRSMSTKEADHGRATYLLRTGRPPGGPIQYPSFGAVVARELGRDDAELPSFVSVAPYRVISPGAISAGFLGPSVAPLLIGEDTNAPISIAEQDVDLDARLKVHDLAAPGEIAPQRARARARLLEDMEADFTTGRPGAAALGHRTAYARARTLMQSSSAEAFNLSHEPASVRDAYGRSVFGQGCLLARRLVERGVPFVEVTLTGVAGLRLLDWDTHANNFNSVAKLSAVLDPAWAALMDDLQARGLLESTLIVWMGEFGRTPRITGQQGRDHWATGWSTVLAGGGIKAGQVIGDTGADGMTLKSRPVSVPDLLATVGCALGLDVRKQNNSNVGRPIRLVEPTAQPLQELLA
jgi:uncharacterized protein (DUF1501 family)